MTINRFSEISGVNSGTLSGTLKGNRPIGLNQLDRITAGMGLPEGHLYDLYINEYLVGSNLDWRRLRPFLYRCAELGHTAYMEIAVNDVVDNLSYVPLLFELAEQLYDEGKLEACKPLYSCVAESEKLQHSERLALSQYRLFSIGLSNDQVNNLTLATRFELFVERLDEQYQFDALNDLINVYASLRRWDKVKQFADQLQIKAFVQYDAKKTLRQVEIKTKKKIIFYALYSYLALSEVSYQYGKYEETLQYVAKYADYSWIKDPTEEEKMVILQFQDWSEGNYYYFRLLSGETDLIQDYLKYISDRKKEIFPALCAIVTAANRYNFNIDAVLEQYRSHLVYEEQSSRIGKVSKQYTNDQYGILLAGLGTYYLRNNDYDKGVDYIRRGMEFAIENMNKDGLLDCLGLFDDLQYCVTGRGDKPSAEQLIEKIQRLYSQEQSNYKKS
ncbi:transcriptional regulator [Paenibacillus sp. JJ-100]|uniref:transcriptional regulator n=1 Tax=Paenibacillus sp. JJ-100 TaxID=2974896 RepID=UPI00232ACD31|nr:transcriptional regulator [Paenibacillus sp. JJ-100]